jgi:hypothetical protein
MNFEELKEIVNNRMAFLDERQKKYLEWSDTIRKLKISGFMVVIVYDHSIKENVEGNPQEVDHALIWQSCKKDDNKKEASRFYIATIEKNDSDMERIYVFPLIESKIELREEFFQKINDDEVEKIITNCMKINPLGFHYINALTDTTTYDGTQYYFERAIERYDEYRRNQSLRGNHGSTRNKISISR